MLRTKKTLHQQKNHIHIPYIDRQYSRNRKIPRHQRHRDANRLLHREHPPPRRRHLCDRPRDPLRLAREPPREAQRVLDLALRFGEGLAGLVGDDVCEVVPVGADQGVPFEQPLGAGARVGLPEALEGRVRGDDGGVDVRGVVVGGAGPDGGGSGVCDIGSVGG